MFIDSFSAPVADLKKSKRTRDNVLSALQENSRISTFDMSENPWLCSIINALKKEGLIVEKEEPYPWHRYEVL